MAAGHVGRRTAMVAGNQFDATVATNRDLVR
jgi:hypothetical protein